MLYKLRARLEQIGSNFSGIIWIEESPIALATKLSLVSVLYILIIEPIIYQTVVKTNQLSFLNHYPKVFFLLFGCTAIVSGFVFGQKKSALLSFADCTLLIIIGITGFYGWFRYIFYPIKSLFQITYVGVLFLTPLTSVAYYLFGLYTKNKSSPRAEPLSDSICLVPDHSLGKLYEKSADVLIKEDKLRYHELAQELLDIIKNVDPQKAFSIGVDAVWGSGKSSLFDILRYVIVPTYNADNPLRQITIIPFSPWLYPDQNSLVRAFFQQLENHIALDYPHFDLSQYVDLVVGEDSSSIGMIKRFFIPSEEMEKAKQRISDALRLSTKRYLIIIDDLDRLEAKEILEVGRLCRIIADFPNTVYLLGYDRVYIDAVLKYDEGYGHKGASYFDKVVQFELRLPHITEEAIASVLDKTIKLNTKMFIAIREDIKEEDINEQVKQISALKFYKSFLHTLRDAKRFSNGLIWRYVSLSRSNKIDFKRVMLLELIFYKFKGKYELLYNRRDDLITHINASDTSGLRELLNPVTNEDYISINRAFQQALSDLLPIFQKSTLETYFSYFNTAGFSGTDIDHLINKDSSRAIIESYFNNGFFVKLFLGFLERLFHAFSNAKLSHQRRVKLDWILYEFYQKFSNEYLGLTEGEEADISSALIYFWQRFEKVDAGKDFDREQQIITIRERLYSWPLKFLKFDPSSNPAISELKANKSRNLKYKPDDDDSSFSFALDLLGAPYIIEFEQPAVVHWRLGLKFSNSEVFPICTGFRLVPGFPLFHLGRDHGNGKERDKLSVKATYYDESNAPVINNKQVNGISFVSNNKIQMRVAYFNNNVQIAIWDGPQIIEVIETLPLRDYYWCKLYAWADNDEINDGKPYSIPVTIKQVV